MRDKQTVYVVVCGMRTVYPSVEVFSSKSEAEAFRDEGRNDRQLFAAIVDVHKP